MALGLLGGSPRQGELHDLLARAGANVATATGMLVQLLRSWPDGGELRQALKDIEHEGDDLTQAVIHHLNTRGPAPFPASDAHELISEIDDVVDYVEEVADFLGLYHVEAATEQALELAGILDAVGAEIAAALAKLSTLRSCARTSWRSTGSRTTATASSAARSRRCSRAGSIRWS